MKKIRTMKRALIAMSGGADSSLAAKQMQDAGFECIGCTMKLYDNEDVGIERTRTCCSLEDVEDAKSVAYSLGIRHYVFNFKEDFREKVIGNFISCYENGRTPNPCIDCNRYMKFEKLYQRAQILNCDYVVTGHYARIEQQADGKYLLKKAVDETKDQSYVLYAMTQEQLAHSMFPLGSLRKSQVRELAGASQFVNAEKPDSQDICFVPDGDYAAFIERYTGRVYQQGDFTDSDGQVLGKHKGLIHYTIGQRKGLGIAVGKPVYVKEIRVADNSVVLGEEKDLYASRFQVSDFNWISGSVPEQEIHCKVKTRYRQKEQAARVIPTGAGSAEIIFDQPQRAITCGQAAVLYDGDVVLGGGTISNIYKD